MKYFNKIHTTIYLSLILLLIAISCGDREELLTDNTLKILAISIDGEDVSNSAEDISKNPQITIVFSHTLNTTALESGLSFSGLSSNAYDIEYANTNSTITIQPNDPLDFETNYTISLAPGIYGQDGTELEENFEFSFTTAPFIPPNVTLEVDNASVSENQESAVIIVSLSQAVEEQVTVDLEISGEATQNIDYTLSKTEVILPIGMTTDTIILSTIQDGEIEGSESVEIAIANITNAVELEPQVLSIVILDDDVDTNMDGFPDRGFIINEVLFDPPGGDAGDANGDGTRSPSEDEFIEFVNDSDREVDLSGFTLYDANNLETLEPRHTFPDGTVIPSGGIYVLFGGGNPSGDFGTAEVAVSTTGNMNLSNADDVITILDNQGNVFLSFDTQIEGAGISFGEDQSITRSPDINGAYTLHTNANAESFFSPGKKADGTNFAGGSVNNGVGFIINEVLFDPPGGDAGDANGDGTRSASEDEFIEFVNDSDESVDLSGYTLFDANNLETMEPRHIFAEGTVIPPGGVYVLFGGGTPTGSFGEAQVAVSTTGNMNLSNSDDVITILDTDNNVFMTFDTQDEGAGIDFGSDQSVTRSPDLEGSFTLHTTVNPALLYSPGTKADGTSF
ncbi:lamin tail domain-containing protein [Portibacter marinus]|uniref:lamin tail domain-containing protein n=1 Tax=Portibacter marinus TaxID=2898660 RepID=UPI001F1D6DC6|nr:lamin tail domain-containing protein [Portibacter marinus]